MTGGGFGATHFQQKRNLVGRTHFPLQQNSHQLYPLLSAALLSVPRIWFKSNTVD